MLKYKVLRKVRKHLPSKIVKLLMEMNFLIKPSKGWYDYKSLVSEYLSYAKIYDLQSISEKSVLELGFGGVFGVSMEFIDRNASKVYCLDPYAPIRKSGNQIIFEKYPDFFKNNSPISERIIHIEETLPKYTQSHPGVKVDFLVSSSVFEHVNEVDDNIKAIYEILEIGGVTVNIIDLRDHYFKYPFNMLNFTETEWMKYNPPSNLNRLRYIDYKRFFEKYFTDIEILVKNRLTDEWNSNYPNLNENFKTDFGFEDAAMIVVIAKKT